MVLRYLYACEVAFQCNLTSPQQQLCSSLDVLSPTIHNEDSLPSLIESIDNLKAFDHLAKDKMFRVQ
ncbi:hypothetical protein E2C01_035281 [Portunus trituberculatus]|uniref:Uncharacterized protein n=1 Tax=Portunus trituberculatus TaxID=210409 RepID=A0A5B7F3T4_PORTR|nr:hypothetical protein [Portunus trituberculatus]